VNIVDLITVRGVDCFEQIRLNGDSDFSKRILRNTPGRVAVAAGGTQGLVVELRISLVAFARNIKKRCINIGFAPIRVRRVANIYAHDFLIKGNNVELK
jgi:hypothetical protein